MSAFKTQTLKPIILETENDNVATADVTKILYTKPNGVKGSWDATVSGNNLIYQPEEGDFDQAGVWKFQSYIEVGTGPGKKIDFGSIASKTFEQPLL